MNSSKLVVKSRERERRGEGGERRRERRGEGKKKGWGGEGRRGGSKSWKEDLFRRQGTSYLGHIEPVS